MSRNYVQQFYVIASRCFAEVHRFFNIISCQLYTSLSPIHWFVTLNYMFRPNRSLSGSILMTCDGRVTSFVLCCFFQQPVWNLILSLYWSADISIYYRPVISYRSSPILSSLIYRRLFQLGFGVYAYILLFLDLIFCFALCIHYSPEESRFF